jgi:hypothetical protein
MEASRAAQIIVERGPETSVGSGYLVAPGRVLTAAHILVGATQVFVRVDAGHGLEALIEAEAWWADAGGAERTDLAVINLGDQIGGGLPRTLFGRISEDAAARLPVQAVGFPRFKYRDDRQFRTKKGRAYRDLEQLAGTAPLLANRRQGTLAINVDDPPPAASGPGGPSPWEGMSGAAVWHGQAIVAVIGEHHAAEGPGRLAARRIDQAYHQLPAPELAALIELLALPADEAGLPDVVPLPSVQLARSAYLAEVRDLAPEVLVGREGELDELTEFCAGPDGYTWWVAGPWTGKTALTSWFVTHPPRGLEVVAFVGGRLVGHADSASFLEAMIRQLMGLVPFAMSADEAVDVRKGTWLTLLDLAARGLREQGRGLVVVVDGLDEDEVGSVPARGSASIASQLPRELPRGVHVIITSRPEPGLPYDVPADHPLRRCPPRELAASTIAADQETRAKQELWDMLNGDQQTVDLVGLITASGGGLTRADLSTLTGRTPHALDTLLLGVFGRSLGRQPARDSDQYESDQEPTYRFAHDTLRALAERELGSAALAQYRDRLYAWAETFAAADWPVRTPRYFVTGYPRMLTASGDTARISALARDQDRHVFLQRSADTDYAVLSEINAALRLQVTSAVPDLGDVAELVVLREIISTRNSLMPVMLPATWERLGRHEHAEALARSILEPEARAQAFAGLVAVTAEGGDLDRAEALARTVTYSKDSASAFDRLIANVAKAGNLDRAKALANVISRDPAKAPAGSSEPVRSTSRQSTRADQAEALTRSIKDPQEHEAVLVALIRSLARSGNTERAEGLTATLSDPEVRSVVVAELATVVAAAGDLGRAQALAGTLDEPARTNALNNLIPDLVEVLAEQGDVERAEALTATITIEYQRTRALRALVPAIGRSGDLSRAEALASTIRPDTSRLPTLVELVSAAAGAGDTDGAEALAAQIGDDHYRSQALTALVSWMTQSGDLDRAEALARTIPADYFRSDALAGLVPAIALTGKVERAEDLVAMITSDRDRSRAVSQLVRVVAEKGDLDSAEEFATARTNDERDAALGTLVAVLARIDIERAESLAATIADSDVRDTALTSLLSSVAETGDLDRAQSLATAIKRKASRTQALVALMLTVARSGDLAGAERIADTITDPRNHAVALSGLAIALVEQGMVKEAWQVAADAEALARTVATMTSRPTVLSSLIGLLATAGDLDQAETLADTITDPLFRGPTLESLVVMIAQTGDLERAERLADTINDPNSHARAWSALSLVITEAGEVDRIEQLIADGTVPSYAVPDLVPVIARSGDLDRAESLAMRIPQEYTRDKALAALVPVIGTAGDLDRAEALARSLKGDTRDEALAALVPVIARSGDLDRAESLAMRIPWGYFRDEALTALVPVIGTAGDLQRAENLAEAISSVGVRYDVLADLEAPAISAGSEAVTAPGVSRALRSVLPALIFTSTWSGAGLDLLRFFPKSALRRACDAAQRAYMPD